MSSPYYPPPRPSYPPPRKEMSGGMLALSILCTIFCCLPFGIVAIVYTAKGEDDRAKPWLIASAVIGLLSIVIAASIASSSN